MPRPREFDEDEVIARAQELFWSRGYEATSVTDLMEATGLAKGSLYKGFGDKRSFFLRTLDAYIDDGFATVRSLLSAAPSPEQGLRRWLMMIVDMATCKGERRGCYAVNCATELASHDPEIRERIEANYRRLQPLLEATVEHGIAEGCFRADLQPAAAARLLLTLVSGLQVQGKLGMTRAEALAMVDLTFDALT